LFAGVSAGAAPDQDMSAGLGTLTWARPHRQAFLAGRYWFNPIDLLHAS